MYGWYVHCYIYLYDSFITTKLEEPILTIIDYRLQWKKISSWVEDKVICLLIKFSLNITVPFQIILQRTFYWF